MRSLLDLDPDLASRLTGERLEAARAAVRVPVVTGRRGEWRLDDCDPAATEQVGLLIVDGVVAREVVIDDVVSSELLGEGDYIAPWTAGPERGAAGEHIRWHVLAPLRAAVLDHRSRPAMAAYPELQQALLERLVIQGERLAALKAFGQINSVERRVLALARHLAARWGRVTNRGIAIPLIISHRLLGELIGARRPSVTTAVSALSRRELLVRETDGTWLLTARGQDTTGARDTPVMGYRRNLART